MAIILFENARSVNAYYSWDPRVILGINAVANHNYQYKANTVGALLVNSARIATFIDNGPWPANAPHVVMVRLHTVRETVAAPVNQFCFGAISQISYADANHTVVTGVPPALSIIGVTPAVNANIATVHIEMDSWYFENYPLGFCVGMLCHEFAVHHLSENNLSAAQRVAEAMTVGPVIGNWAPNVTPATAGQRDHAFAACDTTPRYTEYRATVIEVANAMLAQIGVPAVPGSVPVVAGDVTDLLRCFLMDVASIQVTNDHRASGLTRADAVATCFNNHRAALLVHLGLLNPLVARVPPVISANTVRGNFFYLATSMLWGLLPNYSKSWWGY